MLLSVRPGFNLCRAFFARSMAAFSHPRGQHLVQELSQPAVRRVVLVPRMPILPDLNCFHKNWRPHGPESVDLVEPTNHASRSGKNKVRLEASSQRHEKAARDDPYQIGMVLLEESEFEATMGMVHHPGEYGRTHVRT